MALKKRSSGRWWSRLHFVIRVLGLTALLCICVGVALAYLDDVLDKVVQRALLSSWAYVREVFGGETGDRVALAAVSLFVGGAVVAGLALLVEALAILALAAGRRSAFGLNAVLQVILAAVLLVGINYYSFAHYLRADWTRD